MSEREAWALIADLTREEIEQLHKALMALRAGNEVAKSA